MSLDLKIPTGSDMSLQHQSTKKNKIHRRCQFFSSIISKFAIMTVDISGIMSYINEQV